MRIICEYCGAQFESVGNKVCPHCGASFEDNDTIEAQREKRKKLDEIEVRQRQMDLDEREHQMANAEKQRKRIERNRKTMKAGCVYPVVIITALSIAFTIFSLTGIFKDLSDWSSSDDDSDFDSDIVMDMFDEVTEEKAKTVKVGFNEVADMGDYTFVCDKIEETDRGAFKPTKGYMYVSFHLVIKNTSDEKIYPFSSVACSVDGVVCDETFVSEQKDFRPSSLPSGLSADGYVCFEVPKNAKTFELRYDGVDDSIVTISVENTLS